MDKLININLEGDSMLERIKYSVINLVTFILFWGFFSLEKNVELNILLIISFIVALADITFVNGFKYNKWAYGYLIANRGINLIFILLMCVMMNQFYYWLGFAVYCIAMYNVIRNQWDMVFDDIMIVDIEDCYQYTMYELHSILSSKQKNILEELEQLVDQDKMCTFIATFEAKEIQELLNVELWGIAFLIQKEDYDSINEMIEKIKKRVA